MEFVAYFLTAATLSASISCGWTKSGYERFLEIIADPDDTEFEETMRWCGGHFDPEWFDLGMTDKDLRNALRSNVKRRLYQPTPRAVPKKRI